MKTGPLLFCADDDEDDRLLLKTAFASQAPDCRLVFFADGRELIDALQQARPEAYPTLILLDLNMPRLNGFETLRILKTDTRWRSIPTLILSTSANREDIAESYRLGTNSYVTKPGKYSHLVEVVDITRRYWLEMARTVEGIER